MHSKCQPCFPYGCAIRTNLTQIEMVALEEVDFLLLEKPRYSLVNKVGDNIFAFINQPSACALQNLFSNGTSIHVYKPLDPDAWRKSRNGKKICCLTCSNYPFYKKTNERWDKFLKLHY